MTDVLVVIGCLSVLRDINMASHTKLYNFGRNISPKKSRMKNYTEVNIGEIVYISIIYYISNSWLHLLNVYNGYFRAQISASMR